MNQLSIKSRLGDYDVFFEGNFSFLKKLGDINNQLLIIDRNVYNLYKGYIDANFKKESTFFFDAVEKNKNIKNVIEFYEYLIRCQAKKNITIISIGGGITQDVTGFAASTIYRGVRWIFVPTTFLAQTDSCIGSKTSLNFQSFKNLVGTFYPPSQIYINTRFLHTLTKNDFFSGLGEAIKLQLMKETYPKDINAVVHVIELCKKDKSFAPNLIYDGLKVKNSYMENDEFDHGRRNLLNYGHCFGHALETTSDYYVPHGIAINIGMIFANALSVHRSMLKEDIFRKVTNELNICNIPIDLCKKHFDHDMLLNCMKNDKKRVGKELTVIIPDSEFRLIKVDNVTEDEFGTMLDHVKTLLFK